MPLCVIWCVKIIQILTALLIDLKHSNSLISLSRLSVTNDFMWNGAFHFQFINGWSVSNAWICVVHVSPLPYFFLFSFLLHPTLATLTTTAAGDHHCIPGTLQSILINLVFCFGFILHSISLLRIVSWEP